jgi:hypothetical protein
MSVALWGIVASIIGAVIAIATFARVIISEANRAKRQLEILERLNEIRKEMADNYIGCKVYEIRAKLVDGRMDGHERRLDRLESTRLRA